MTSAMVSSGRLQPEIYPKGCDHGRSLPQENLHDVISDVEGRFPINPIRAPSIGDGEADWGGE